MDVSDLPEDTFDSSDIIKKYKSIRHNFINKRLMFRTSLKPLTKK